MFWEVANVILEKDRLVWLLRRLSGAVLWITLTEWSDRVKEWLHNMVGVLILLSVITELRQLIGFMLHLCAQPRIMQILHRSMKKF